jgi:hypothetical protein
MGCHFHHLVVPAGLARLWIPAFAGMTMKAKAAGMGGSSENRCHHDREECLSNLWANGYPGFSSKSSPRCRLELIVAGFVEHNAVSAPLTHRLAAVRRRSFANPALQKKITPCRHEADQ